MKTPYLNSYDAESRFVKALEALKQKIKTIPNADEKVGAYWEEGWHRAPFEEELTLKQISSLSSDILIKKKSFTPEKMIALAVALEKALASERKAAPVEDEARSHRSEPTIVASQPFALLPASYSVHDSIYFLGIQKMTQEIFHSLDSFMDFFSFLFNEIGNGKILNPWSNDQKTSIQQKRKDQKKILESMSKFIPEVSLHFRTALTGPGTSLENLMASYHIGTKHLEVGEILLQPILKALEALPIVINKKMIPGHYSLHPETAETIFKALKGNAIKDKKRFFETFSLPFPFFNLAVVWKQLN